LTWERVVVVSTPGTKVYVRSGVVYAKPPDSDPVPITHDTELVLLATGAVSVSGRALRRLSELGVRLLVLGQRGQVVAEMRPVDRVNRTVETRMAQYAAKLEGRALYYAAEMVVAKIVNQARLLRYLARSRRETWLRNEAYRVEEEAHSIHKMVVGGELSAEALRAVEARAAKKYWQAIAALLPQDYGFTGRNPLGDDGVNKALNYAYAILYGVVHDALTVAGLDPYAGFLHADRSGKPSLVYDYSDTYKPIAVDKNLFTNIDQECFTLYQGSLTYQARKCIATRATTGIYSATIPDSAGKKRTIRDHIYAYAWQLAKALRNKTAYKAFTARL
jgi:CRISPR-associated protein Cas1